MLCRMSLVFEVVLSRCLMHSTKNRKIESILKSYRITFKLLQLLFF